MVALLRLEIRLLVSMVNQERDERDSSYRQNIAGSWNGGQGSSQLQPNQHLWLSGMLLIRRAAGVCAITGEEVLWELLSRWGRKLNCCVNYELIAISRDPVEINSKPAIPERP